MADRHRNAEAGQPARIGAVDQVAALHPVAEIVQYLGDAAHADAADPDEMNGSDRFGQRPHAAFSPRSPDLPDSLTARFPAIPGTRARTIWASRSAASSGAKLRACVAAWASPALSASRSARRPVSIGALSPDCGTSQPAPAAAKARALAAW